MKNAKPQRYLAMALWLLGVLGCKDSFHVGTSKPDGALSDGSYGGNSSGGNPGSRGVSSTAPASGGSSGTGGTGSTSLNLDAGPLADASRASPDVPASEPDSRAADVPRSFSDAAAADRSSDGPGAVSVDGPSETGGTPGISLLGIACGTDLDCPADSRCCNSADPSCDGTRLPEGDRVNPGQFLPSSDGLTVTDTITGLTWQRDGAGARAGCSGAGNLRCTWNEAQAYCASLTLGNFDDWRLPGWNELINITDLTNDPNTQPLDQIAFPGTPMEGFWTSSRLANTSCSGEIYVNFTNATLGTCAAQDLRVRCVRGSRCYPKTRFVVLDTERDADGAQVRDTLTGLTWQQLVKMPLPECANWRDAQRYCASLGQGFRLPTFKELESLIGPDMGLDRTIFSPTRCDYTWTSTPYGGGDATVTGTARCPRESSLNTGQNWLSIAPRYGVRCVR